MKMERLIGILSILLQQEKVTAPELAEQFEVSRRTIQRDIESLCRAGIPISTAQGAGGGISIMEGYRVDRTMLTAGEPFEPRSAPLPDLEPERVFPAQYQVTVLFDPSCRWRLVEEYGADRFTVEPDGRLRFTGGFPDADSVLSWVLTFGDKAELLEPEELRNQLGALTKALADCYRRD